MSTSEGKSESVAETSDEATKPPVEAYRTLCSHYSRGCSLVSPCCDKVYPCRLCHNEKEPTHEIDRYKVSEVVCRKCHQRQPVAGSCVECGTSFGRYYCSVCHLYADEDKGQFHCDKCGLCRVGGRENFFHCDTCGYCLALSTKDSHVCRQQASKNNCPVCMEDLHTSCSAIYPTKCGHLLHEACYKEMGKKGLYQCPQCQRSLADMTNVWKRYDEERSMWQMPRYLRDFKVKVQCRDCQKETETEFHVVGFKCGNCGSYNTVRSGSEEMPEDGGQQERGEEGGGGEGERGVDGEGEEEEEETAGGNIQAPVILPSLNYMRLVWRSVTALGRYSDETGVESEEDWEAIMQVDDTELMNHLHEIGYIDDEELHTPFTGEYESDENEIVIPPAPPGYIPSDQREDATSEDRGTENDAAMGQLCVEPEPDQAPGSGLRTEPDQSSPHEEPEQATGLHTEPDQSSPHEQPEQATGLHTEPDQSSHHEEPEQATGLHTEPDQSSHHEEPERATASPHVDLNAAQLLPQHRHDSSSELELRMSLPIALDISDWSNSNTQSDSHSLNSDSSWETEEVEEIIGGAPDGISPNEPQGDSEDWDRELGDSETIATATLPLETDRGPLRDDAYDAHIRLDQNGTTSGESPTESDERALVR